MIDKDEINTKSNELGVNTSDVQRDYVFGWLLSGIHHASDVLKKTLILKGGNCFRKAYFENTRYSNDLDFSTQVEVNPDEMKNQINSVCEYVGDQTGVKFALEDNIIRLKKGADADAKTYEGRVYFKGFYGEEKYNIRVSLDIKEYDKIFLPTQMRNIIHPYSDYKNCTGEIVSLKLEELLASKLKALLQRRHSPDLFDFIYSIFFQKQLSVNRKEVITTFLKKTIYEPNPQVAKNLLLELPFQTLKAFWNKYLVCPKDSFIVFEDAEKKFLSAIPIFFESVFSTQVYIGGGGVGTESLNYFPANYRNVIMEAGQEQKLLRMDYDGLERLVEPYALKYKIRQDGVGKEYFYAWDRTGGRSGIMSIKSYLQNKVQSLEKTSEKFSPRFTIELSKAGELTNNSYFGKPFSERAPRLKKPKIKTITRRKPRASLYSGMTYTIECSMCNKRFKRSSYNTKLNKHKDRYGNQCYGGYGYMV